MTILSFLFGFNFLFPGQLLPVFSSIKSRQNPTSPYRDLTLHNQDGEVLTREPFGISISALVLMFFLWFPWVLRELLVRQEPWELPFNTLLKETLFDPLSVCWAAFLSTLQVESDSFDQLHCSSPILLLIPILSCLKEPPCISLPWNLWVIRVSHWPWSNLHLLYSSVSI